MNESQSIEQDGREGRGVYGTENWIAVNASLNSLTKDSQEIPVFDHFYSASTSDSQCNSWLKFLRLHQGSTAFF